MKSCHFYRIAQCSSKNSMTLSSFSMTFAIFHDFPGLENGLPKFHDVGMTRGHPAKLAWVAGYVVRQFTA